MFSLASFFAQITSCNALVLLDISYNSANYQPRFKPFELKPESFEANLSKFLEMSETLVHLDISGTCLSNEQCNYIAINGLRKSRSLMAVHMRGMGFKNNEILAFRHALKVRQSFSFYTTVDQEIMKHEIAKIHTLEMQNVLGKSIYNTNRAINATLNKSSGNHVAKVKASIKNPLYEHDESEKIVYHRILGRYEAVGSNYWTEQIDSKCLMCCKNNFCMIIWNKRLSKQLKHFLFYNHQSSEPLIFKRKEYNHPLMATLNQIHQMIPIREFHKRLLIQKEYDNLPRNTNNELEQ